MVNGKLLRGISSVKEKCLIKLTEILAKGRAG